MTDTAGGPPPFPGFPGFPPAEMLDNMWGMMRLTPFGSAFPGMQPGTAKGFGGPLAAMSDLMKPLMDVEELDKRITDMRAVEQWLKLNLNMLQSATQALEVQRATLSTLSAFGAFAQASMTQPADAANAAAAGHAASAQTKTSSPWGASASASSGPSSNATSGGTASAESADQAPGTGAQAGAAFDPSVWWNLLQSQFNQLAAFAMTPPDAAGSEAGAEPEAKADAEADAKADAKTSSSREPGARGEKASGGSAAASSKPAAKRAPARKSGAKPASGVRGTPREEK